MADFVKYNGYNVKDAYALAHASLSGNTLSTTDRKGRPVDSIELPTGLTTSAVPMSFWPKKLVKAYAISSKDAFVNANTTSGVYFPCAVGQVLGSEMIGYGEISWDTSNSKYLLTGIRALTTHGWQTFTKDITQDGASNRSTYRNNLCRQFRPSTYKAYVNVGMKDKSITIAAGAKQTICSVAGSSGITIPVADPGGVGIGYASVAKAIPTVGIDADGTGTKIGAGLQLYFGFVDTATKEIVAYNPTSSPIVIQSFVIELDVVLFNENVSNFYFNEPDAPFIEGINCTSLTNDPTDGMVEQTSVVVKHHDTQSSLYLIEAKLTLNTSTGEWSWVKSDQEALGQGPIEGNNHNLIYNFSHTILSADWSNMQVYTSAVAYAIGASGSSIGATHGFTDAIPIPAYINVDPN